MLVQNRQGPEAIVPPAQPNALPNSPQGIGTVPDCLNWTHEGPVSCHCVCLTWIKSIFNWFSIKFFGGVVSSEELIEKGEEIRGSNIVFFDNHQSFPSKIIITIKLNDTFVATVKEDLRNHADAAQFSQTYEATLRETLQAQELTGDAVLKITTYLYNRVALTPEQIQARRRPEPFVYDMFRSKNTYDFRSIWDPACIELNQTYGQYNPHLLLYHEVNDPNNPQFRTEIQEFLARPL